MNETFASAAGKTAGVRLPAAKQGVSASERKKLCCETKRR